VIGGFQNIPKIPELRKRIIISFLLLAVYRIGVHIPTPGIQAVRIPLEGNLAYEFLHDKGQALCIDDVRTHPVTAKGSEMPIEGMDERGVHIGIDFLDRIAGGERPSLGDRVAVVGGGNTAMDVCRTAVRLGARDVHVLYRRTEREMPAHADEIAEAREEGVNLSFLVTPVRIARTNGSLEIECLRMELGEPDESGRRRPVPIEGSEFTVEADTCIMAIGQQVSDYMAGQAGVTVTRWGTFEVDGKTVSLRIVGGLLGQWACWTKKAVEHLERIRTIRDDVENVPHDLLTLAGQLTLANREIFDARNNFAGCIPGISYVLKRQGLLDEPRSLDPGERLSPGQADRIDRIIRDHPNLTDDGFVSANLDEWLAS